MLEDEDVIVFVLNITFVSVIFLFKHKKYANVLCLYLSVFMKMPEKKEGEVEIINTMRN